MRFVEKKCPNCGANLEFKENDTSCKCDYCKREFVIERDSSNPSNDISDQFSLVYNQVEKTFKFVSVMHMFIFIFVFIIIIAVFLAIFFGFKNNFQGFENFSFKDKKSDKSEKYITDITQINNFDYSFVDSSSIITISREENSTMYFHKTGSEKRIKTYLASKENGNILIPIYKVVYSSDENSYTLFIPVLYENIRVDNVSFDVSNGRVEAPLTYFNLEHSEYAVGYQDLDSLYSNVIKPLENDYVISEK